MFLGLPDPNPDPLVRDTDPDPYVFCLTDRLVRGTDPDHQAKIVRQTLIPTVL